MDVKTLSNEALAAEATKTREALAALIAAAGDAPTTEQITEATALDATLSAIKVEAGERKAALDGFSKIKAGFAADGDPEPEPEPEPEPTPEPEPAADPEPEPEPTKTEASAKPKGIADFGNKGQRPATPAASQGSLVIRAAQNVPTFSAGGHMEGLADIAKGVVERSRGFTPPSGDGKTESWQQFGVASIALPFNEDLVIDRGSDDYAVVTRAANEARLGQDGLTAAGWCSPSEVLYDLAADESLDGILSVPEVQIKRGGMRWTEGPQFADFYRNAGFVMTEAQAIAGLEKPCYTVECPEWQEIRLDAIGLCLRIDILQNAAYPELTQRFVSGTMVAHQHMVNADVLSRMTALAGPARVVTGLGSTVSDSLEALELVADQRRERYRLSFNRTMEVVVDYWVKGAHRSDLARRQGVGAEAISDAQIAAHFTARNLKVSYVYDWHNLLIPDDGVTTTVDENQARLDYPATYDVLMYPAGTFVKGVSDVININAVYDAASLKQNTYTGLFMEQGLLVAKVQYGVDHLRLPICNAGRVGAADLTCI